jgi:hypothetical protein
LRARGCVPEAVRGAKSAGNHPDLSNGTERGSWEIFTAGLGGHEEFLIDQVRRRRPLGDKAQLEMVDDAIDHGEIREEGNGLHLSEIIQEANVGVRMRDDVKLSTNICATKLESVQLFENKNFEDIFRSLKSGFYYLWLPQASR